MMCKERGLMEGGNLSSASTRSISSPVSRFLTLICLRISYKYVKQSRVQFKINVQKFKVSIGSEKEIKSRERWRERKY